MTSTRRPSTQTNPTIGATAPPATGRRHLRRRRRRRNTTRALLWLLAALVGVVVALGVAWTLDTRAADDETLRNVEVAGRGVGRLDADGVRAVVASVADSYAGATVVIRSGSDAIEVPAPDLGLAVDQDATVAAALDEGRDDPLLERPLAWLSSLFRPRSSPVLVVVDPAKVASVVEAEDPTGRSPAVEPSLRGEGGVVEVVPGSEGQGLDAAAIAGALPAAAADGLPVSLEASPVTLVPRFSVEDAGALAASVEALTAEPLVVQAAGITAELAPATLRDWVTSRAGDGELELAFDVTETTDSLAAALGEAGEPPVDAGFEVEDGNVVVVPGRDGTACCDAGSADLLVQALEERPATPVTLPLRPVVPPVRTTEAAEALGIVEPVGAFTTNHAAGESRVVNIHRIADIIRGVVIEPGTTFSVNDFVGRRTRANGFVEGGVIQDGVFEVSVGGGISQFATTLFNAAFFGGLDFEEYQSHSIYISRYPYGREATLSFPRPDLRIVNTTPHGVLIWPTYTGSSITVTLYSTRYATGEQTGQSTSPAGACRRVTTERTRTYVDGRVEVDTVFATYRPGEGIDC